MDPLTSARLVLHRVAVHIVARARLAETGRFSLRVTPGGFGTPEFGVTVRRVRVAGGDLIVESDAPGAPSAVAMGIDGHSLAELATFVAVDLGTPIDVGHDTPPVGSLDEPISLDAEAATEVCGWFAIAASILDQVLAALPIDAQATPPRLWPEHFDLAVEAQARPDRRVNLGGSPGDGFSEAPYLYVGPWTSDRPGESAFWNASFGASRTWQEISSMPGQPLTTGSAFLLGGVARLAQPG